MKIVVGVPSFDYVPADTFASLFATFSSERDKRLIYVNSRSSLVQEARFMLVKAAREAEADKILMIDSDHTFPPDTISRLLAHDKEMVGATYVRRRPPHNILGRTLEGYNFNSKLTGLQKVGLMPLGCMLIDMWLFDKVELPWFCVGFDLKRQLWTGEDFGFCTGVRQHGYDVWCDFELSREIGHVGQKTYFWADAPPDEEYVYVEDTKDEE